MRYSIPIGFFVLLSYPLYSDSNAIRFQCLENRVLELERQSQECCAVPPAACPTTRCGCGFFIFGDLLYWQARQNGMGFAIKSDSAPSLFNTIGKGKIKNPDSDWTFGFHVGLGFRTGHDEWDIPVAWTRFHTSSHKRTRASTNESIFPVYSNPNSLVNVSGTSAKARWKLDIDMVDLDLGRAFYASRWLTLRPHIGLRSAWIKQKYNIEYEGLIFGPQEREVDMKNDFWGLGMRAGLDTEWCLGCGFSIAGNFAFSFLYGRFDIHHEETTVTNGVDQRIFKVTDHNNVGRIISDFLIGLRYDYMCADDCFHFSLQLAWEYHMFFGQNQFMRFVDDATQGVFVSNQGDLTTQGPSFSIRFDY